MKHKVLARSVASSALLALTACGGGGGTGGSTPIAVVPGSTPMPMPMPMPMPAATATPTPSAAPTVPAYATANDFTRDLVIDGQLGFTIDTFEPASGGSYTFVGGSMFANDARYTLAYTVSPDTARLTLNGAVDSYTTMELNYAGTQRYYRRLGEADLLVGLETGRTATSTTKIGSALYTPETRAGIAGQRRSLRMAVAGRPTLAADALPSPLSFRGLALVLGGTTDRALFASTDTLSFSLTGDGLVQGYVSVLGFGGTQVILTFSGTLDRATNSIQGTIADTRAGFAGQFRGQLFGPNGAELGLVYRAERTGDGAVLAGEYVGTR